MLGTAALRTVTEEIYSIFFWVYSSQSVTKLVRLQALLNRASAGMRHVSSHRYHGHDASRAGRGLACCGFRIQQSLRDISWVYRRDCPDFTWQTR